MNGAVALLVVAVIVGTLPVGGGRAQDRASLAVCDQPGDRTEKSVSTDAFTVSPPSLTPLSPGEIAAIVNYIRTAWDNDFDLTTPGEIAAVIGALGGKESEEAIVWDGVFTSDQVARGEAAYVTCTIMRPATPMPPPP
jgi:hypothetical protein